MRFNKKSRKIRPKKKTQRREKARNTFWYFLAGGGVVLCVFLFLGYGKHEESLSKVREAKMWGDFDQICLAAQLYYKKNGRYPTTAEGLEALRLDVDQTQDAPPGHSGEKYLHRIPLDPWGNHYIYKGSASGQSLQLTCLGTDGREGGKGESADVTREGCGFTRPDSR